MAKAMQVGTTRKTISASKRWGWNASSDNQCSRNDDWHKAIRNTLTRKVFSRIYALRLNRPWMQITSGPYVASS
jgi:hypothetical protein